MATGDKAKFMRSKGFRKTVSLVEDRLRQVGETRGFAVTRLITHWEEVAGADTARVCTPVKVSYAQRGFGATLTLLTTGAQAPMLELQLEQIRARVNGCYGYNAISRVRLTQTAPTGFAEPQAAFAHKPKPKLDPAACEDAQQAASEVKDPALRQALEAFGANVISQERRN